MGVLALRALAWLRAHPGALVLAAVVAVGVWAWWQERTARSAAEVALLRALATPQRLDDSTTAVLATDLRQQLDSLAGLVHAAERLGGQLQAGVRLRIAARDTVLVHDTLPTDVSADSTRTARFRDSTFAGVLSGTVTAPPCCAPLSLSYQIHRPAFSPTVGFVRAHGQDVAVVTWQGERVEVSAPYVRAQPPEARPLTRQVSVVVDQELRVIAGAGLARRLWPGIALTGQVSRPVTGPEPKTRLTAGLRATF